MDGDNYGPTCLCCGLPILIIAFISAFIDEFPLLGNTSFFLAGCIIVIFPLLGLFLFLQPKGTGSDRFTIVVCFGVPFLLFIIYSIHGMFSDMVGLIFFALLIIAFLIYLKL